MEWNTRSIRDAASPVILLGLSALFAGYLLSLDPLDVYARGFALVFGAVSMTLTSFLFVKTLLTARASLVPREYLINAVVVTWATVFALVVCESAFMLCAKTHGVGVSLAGQLWRKRFLSYNSEGYRDTPSAFLDAADKVKIAVLGDSFTMGHGIAAVEDRFTNVLQRKLPQEFKVVNLGLGGTDSRNQFQRLSKVPFTPNVLVLQYFGNDISEAAASLGKPHPGIHLYSDLPSELLFSVKNSYFLNWIYWSIPRSDHRDWWDYFERMYEDRGVLREHEKDLDAFVSYSRDHRIPFYVVLFPFLHRDLQASYGVRRFVKDFCSKNNVSLLDVSDLVRDLSIEDRVANNNDVHASVVVHRRVGEALYDELRKVL
jgi:hypothetical protein